MSDQAEQFRAIAARHARCFWLDGVGARPWSGRRSVLGWLTPDDVSLAYDARTREVTRHAGGRAEVVGDDPFTVLAEELAAGSPADRWYGYLGYAARADLPAYPSRRDGAGLPDAVWMRPSQIRVVEGPLLGHSSVFSAMAMPQNMGDPRLTGDPTPSPSPSPTPTYRAAFAQVQEHLHAGESYEVNLTHRLTLAGDPDPVATYLRLRELNPAPYAGFLQHDVPGAEAWLLGSSPERYALVERGPDGERTIETRPIKGTTPRGATPDEDERWRTELRTAARFRSENLMIVDLLRNDLAQVCEPGTVQVPELMAVESYETVHQLVSTVRGRLREDVATVDALRALFPAGSMTGAPKLRTMQVIEEVEDTPRGAYAGALGWVGADGRADLGVVIRALTTAGDGTWQVGTGGGVTVHSTVEAEYAEAVLKAERVALAVGRG